MQLSKDKTKVVVIGVAEELAEIEVPTKYCCKQRGLRARRRSHCVR